MVPQPQHPIQTMKLQIMQTFSLKRKSKPHLSRLSRLLCVTEVVKLINIGRDWCVIGMIGGSVFVAKLCFYGFSVNSLPDIFILQVKILSLYYQYMEPYMGQALFPITLEAMKSDVDEISLQGIEFWSNVSDEEIDLAIEEVEASDAGMYLFLKNQDSSYAVYFFYPWISIRATAGQDVEVLRQGSATIPSPRAHEETHKTR